ncbi:MAG: tripartite ATP-independent periplasmic transporter, DctQ component [Burkholderia sp.]|jgi:TRAP-type mannitol/chloroaromatic compound transport system permease small subunit|nr:tripartite ATP-independent periplasmic transporter, DctQ component [Burkholderia sp.]
MSFFLSLSGFIDKFNEQVGKVAVWMVLLSCLVSAGNAASRYALDLSSNAWLEIQWYMFAGIVLLGAAYTLKRNEHVRVDVMYGRFRPRTQAWVDLLGMILFVMPTCLILLWMSWPFFLDAYTSGETSSNAGGLIRWPVKIMLPIGFAMLAAQGISEIIKRIGYLVGSFNMDIQYERPLQ